MTETNHTAVVTASGEGRDSGRAASSDGLLGLPLAVPKECGGDGRAADPEQLLAAGSSTCFLGAEKITAAQRKVRVRDLAVVAEAALRHRHAQGDYALSAVLHPEFGGVGRKAAAGLGAGAHQIRPCSTAPAVPVTVPATVA
ncbi:osmotically inducible protein OsmC [Actinacidiphila sp. bgisy160]|uniref:osmotically inducible protein OsmC n=1 Tax=Actinacidiphila sp. bgisy160 TaxID=3413796 RepID=UPI003D72438F